MKVIEKISSMEELKEAVNVYAKIGRELASQEALMNKELDEIKRKFDVKKCPSQSKQGSLENNYSRLCGRE